MAAQGCGSGDDGGDEKVQDTLVDMLGLQIGQQHVKGHFEDESERLRAAAEAVRRPHWPPHPRLSKRVQHSIVVLQEARQRWLRADLMARAAGQRVVEG